MTACDDCLRRAWLLGRVAGYVERARHDQVRLRDVLALDDRSLIAAVGAGDAPEVSRAWATLSVDTVRAAAAAAGLACVCPHTPRGYPARLRDVAGAPRALFVAAGDPDRAVRLLGDDSTEPPAAVAIVGARRATAGGLEVARGLGRGLAAAGVTVVSGMALGVDAAAHAGALEVRGPTVAVLAGGADVAYPASKRHIHRELIADHCVVSEMPPGFGPHRWCFPARNRTIAGLAQLTVVVEAATRSGSLITADFATQMGRDVAAVPGSVLATQSGGTNALLRDGAILVRDTQDVLDALFDAGCLTARPTAAASTAAARVGALEPRLRNLLDEVCAGRDSLEALVRERGDVQTAMAGLAELELLGVLRRAPGGRYLPAAG
jgi:DNA processing protein